jgi:hypothetical protein
MHCVEGISRKYALDKPTLPSLCPMQAGIDLIQIEVVSLEEVGFLLLEKPRCPLVNQVGDDISALVNQPSTCAPRNLFGDGPFAHVYKPLDLNAWPKSRNRKNIHHLGMFKLFIMQENNWEVG